MEARYLGSACQEDVICLSAPSRGRARGVPGGPLPPQNFAWPPKNFSGLLLKVLHRPLTAPLVAKLAPPVAPPNENVWLRPCPRQLRHCHQPIAKSTIRQNINAKRGNLFYAAGNRVI